MSYEPSDDVGRFLPLKPVELSVLMALAEAERYGYEIVKRIAERTAGSVRLAPGNLYPVLDRLIESGLVESKRRVDRSDPRRRYYGITALGRRVVRAEAERLREVVRTAEQLALLPVRSR